MKTISLDMFGGERKEVPVLKEARGLCLHRSECKTEEGRTVPGLGFVVSHRGTGRKICVGSRKQCERALAILARLDWADVTQASMSDAHRALGSSVAAAVDGRGEWPE